MLVCFIGNVQFTFKSVAKADYFARQNKVVLFRIWKGENENERVSNRNH